MKIEGVCLTKSMSKKGYYIYDFLTQDEGQQKVVKVISKGNYDLNKKIEVSFFLPKSIFGIIK